MTRKDSQPITLEDRTELKEFPIDPLERLGKVLCAANIGPKATTLLLLPHHGFIPPYPDLSNSFKNVMAGSSMEQVAYATPAGYAEQSLVEVGLVAKKVTINYFGQDKTVGFGLSTAGIKYGVPAAALALFFENKHDVSLFPVLGSVNSKSAEESRAPLNRAVIMWFLATQSKPVSEQEICKNTHLSHSVVNGTLPELAKSGTITYATYMEKGVRAIQYDFASEHKAEVTPVNKEPRLTRVIADICRKNKGSSITAEFVLANIPQEIKGGRKQDSLLINISTILSGLANQGLLERVHGFKGHELQSAITLTEQGRLVVQEFLDPLLTIMNDTVDEEVIKDLVQRVSADLLPVARKSADLYYPFSMSSKRKQQTENIGRVYDLLQPDIELGAPEIARRLGIHPHSVYNYTLQLVEKGKLAKVQVGKQFVYRRAK